MEMITTVTALKGILEVLSRFVQTEENVARLPLFNLLCKPDGPLKECEKLLGGIEARITSKTEHSGTFKGITWPWQYDEMSKKLKTIEKHKQTLTLALQSDVATTTLVVQNTVNETCTVAKEGRDIVSNIQREIHTEKDIKIVKWLATTDPSVNHSAAREKWEEGTGDWFISSTKFSGWFSRPRSSLWLHGIPGAGKTILCSTVIENVRLLSNPTDICAFFYFDSSSTDVSKQMVSNMFSSFLSQISSNTIPRAVYQLYEQCHHGTRSPSLDELVKTLLACDLEGRRLYLIVDALDECSEGTKLLKSLERILQSANEVSLLVTSRKEYEIEDTLGLLIEDSISMDDKHVDPDIRKHVEHCLQEDRKLSKWDVGIKTEIVEALVSRANGMYVPTHLLMACR